MTAPKQPEPSDSVSPEEAARKAAAHARKIAHLKPPWPKGFRPPGAGGRRKDRIISAALLAKMVRKRAKSVAEALIKQAEEGNVFAFNSLADRVEGKVVQQIEVSGNVDLGVRIAAARARMRTEPNETAVEAQIVPALREASELPPNVGKPDHSDDRRGEDILDIADIFGK